MSLFATPEQMFADKLCEELNKLDTVFKGTFYVEEYGLETWTHVVLKNRVLCICIKSPLNSTKNSFIQFGGDHKSQVNLYNCEQLSEWIGKVSEDKDFSIAITPWNIQCYYHNFEKKKWGEV